MPGIVVSERMHEGGLVIRLILVAADIYSVSVDRDTTGTWWPTFNAENAARAKAYVDDVLRAGPHDCARLDCAGWSDSVNAG